jgi:alpha-beta hydrolase superfamily lysophospholipase
MSKPAFEHVELDGSGGHRIRSFFMAPKVAQVGAIQILHGLGEHAARYERFARQASQRGFSVIVHDHRGHGEQRLHAGYFGGPGSWQDVLDDASLVMRYVRDRLPNAPLALLGHSMGSFLAQHVAMQHGAQLSALLLSGSNRPSPALSTAAWLLARAECLRLGERSHSPLLDKLGFGNFNRSFEPARSELDWLSRDADEVDRYIADPLCGGPYTAGLWRELTSALRDLGNDTRLQEIPADLPILITGGAADPVGGEKGLAELARHYERSGHAQVSLKIYAGGRHEMLNEINRDEVTADWLGWFERVMK